MWSVKYIYLIETHIICVVISEYTTVSESTVVEVISPEGRNRLSVGVITPGGCSRLTGST